MKPLTIVMYAANLRHWGKLYPNAPFEDVPSPAGTELALLGVSRGLARLGHHVTVFANCDGGVYDGVNYLSADLALPYLTTLNSDVVVSWQDANVFLYPVKTKLRVLMNQSSQLGLGQAAAQVDRYFSISRYSAQLLLDSDPYAEPEKMWVTRNGVWPERFTRTYERNYHQLVWASSPDRGLHHLVDIFKKVREQVPDATLKIAYEFDRTLENYKKALPGSVYVRWLEKAAELKNMPGVEVLNHISQPKMAKLLLESGVFAYPCDPIRATETYCNAVNEAMAAGLPCVISDADCLPENFGTAAKVLPRPIDRKAWADTITLLMTEPGYWSHYSEESRTLADQTDYNGVAKDWEDFFTEYLSGQETTVDRSLSSLLEAV